MIRQEHAPSIGRIIRGDLARHRKGLQQAADRLAPGFVKVSGEQQERDMRWALRKIQEPPKGIPELVVSAMSFMAAVNMDGVVVARDTRNPKDDLMKGLQLGEKFPIVREALGGKRGAQIGQFESPKEGERPSVTVLMAAPAHYHGKVVGALLLGIPLWRLQQRLSKQLMLDNAKHAGILLWVYLHYGAELHHHGTPPDLDKLVPGPEVRKAGYARSPGGFTGEVQQFGRWYGWGVIPLRMLGPEVGAIIFRSDPL